MSDQPYCSSSCKQRVTSVLPADMMKTTRRSANNGKRTLRCRREENRSGKTVDAIEQAIGSQEELSAQRQSNIVYYFIELRRPPGLREPGRQEGHGWNARLNH